MKRTADACSTPCSATPMRRRAAPPTGASLAYEFRHIAERVRVAPDRRARTCSATSQSAYVFRQVAELRTEIIECAYGANRLLVQPVFGIVVGDIMVRAPLAGVLRRFSLMQESMVTHIRPPSSTAMRAPLLGAGSERLATVLVAWEYCPLAITGRVSVWRVGWLQWPWCSNRGKGRMSTALGQ